MAKRVLAVVSEPLSAEVLRSALGEDADEAEVLVVAPALSGSRLRFWTSDSDDAIARADWVQEESVARLDEQGIAAAGDTGESDPLLALQDALQTFPADEIVLFTHGDDDRDWLEEGVVDEAQARFERPVRHVVADA